MVALVLLVAALPWAALAPADAATPGVAAGPRAAPAARAAVEADPLKVVIERLTPSTIPDRAQDRITVSGSIVNRSDTTWTSLQVYLLTSYDPLTTAADLGAALESDPRLDLGGNRIITPGLFADVPDLAPGRLDALHAHGPPFRPRDLRRPRGLLAQRAGPRRRARTGGSRARTGGPAPSSRWCRRTRRRPRSPWACSSASTSCARPRVSCSTSPRWQQTLTPDGRLGRLLRLEPEVRRRSRSPGSSTRPCCRPPSPSRTGNPSATLTPDPGQTAAEQAAAGSDDQPEGAAQDLPAEARLAGRGCGRFDRDASGHTVLALPFADLDVSAAQRAGARRPARARGGESTRVLDARGISSRPVVAPPDRLPVAGGDRVPRPAGAGLPVRGGCRRTSRPAASRSPSGPAAAGSSRCRAGPRCSSRGPRG